MYTLHRATYIVRKNYQSPASLKVFATILRNNRVIRYVHSLYEAAPLFIKGVLVLLYGLKCYLALGWEQNATGHIAFFAPFPNERQVLRKVRDILGKSNHNEFTISLRHCLNVGVLADLLAFAVCSHRLYRYARRVAPASFIHACLPHLHYAGLLYAFSPIAGR